MEVANTSSRATRMRFLVMFEFLSLFFMIYFLVEVIRLSFSFFL